VIEVTKIVNLQSNCRKRQQKDEKNQTAVMDWKLQQEGGRLG